MSESLAHRYGEFCLIFDGKTGDDSALFTPSTAGGDPPTPSGSASERKHTAARVVKIKTALTEYLNRGQSTKSKHRSDGQQYLAGFQKFDVSPTALT